MSKDYSAVNELDVVNVKWKHYDSSTITVIRIPYKEYEIVINLGVGPKNRDTYDEIVVNSPYGLNITGLLIDLNPLDKVRPFGENLKILFSMIDDYRIKGV